ncbi:MAG: hypothetical protein JWN03_756 [Nocardia sp.]|uniref:MFS transporter n=1 Tax=Nocardia sp. TaxID=1821 RepID=UPI0026093D20|nr:MFS transporter [Nocardia sp.]MCU1640481.1 hypothetical protein [Nocardia sp.]
MNPFATAPSTPAALPDSPPADDSAPAPRLRRLFATVPFASACPQLAFVAIGYFAALQVQSFDSVHKVEKLALVHAAVAAASMITQPLIGVLSDRTRTRFGARTPWMLLGALVGCLALVAAGSSRSIAWLLAAAVVAHIGFSTFNGPLTAIQPDRVPADRRGRYSALAGVGTIAAGILGPALGSVFTHRISLGYLLFAAVILLAATVFLVVNPDRDNRGAPRPGFSPAVFAKAFWVNPIRYPDFFWVFLGRILLFGGYFMVINYQLYIIEDYIGLTLDEATRLIPVISIASLPGFLLAIGISGPLSDRIGRRKPMVFAGGLVIAVSALIPVISATVGGLICSIVVLTIGFGIFMAVDQALVTQVLPDAGTAAKDLGIINIAATLPNTIGPLAAAGIVTACGYTTLYLVVALIAGVGAFAVLPVKVR